MSQVEVLREWLRVERSHPEVDWFPIESLSEREALDELLDRKPGAAAFVWRDAPVRWYETTLHRADFEGLQLVEGPPSLRWRALSPDGTVCAAADRIARGDPDELAAETDVDVRTVLEFVEEMPEGPLVVSTREGASRGTSPTATTARWRCRSGCARGVLAPVRVPRRRQEPRCQTAVRAGLRGGSGVFGGGSLPNG
ncbi:hypothetical protein [Halorussus caseinilyticus]|uniref:Uncharacterized protein n=1 Tax=Halorussus caseinilyticus TaxID=3034025 RepID=A0ABD5WU56_9EURY